MIYRDWNGNEITKDEFESVFGPLQIKQGNDASVVEIHMARYSPTLMAYVYDKSGNPKAWEFVRMGYEHGIWDIPTKQETGAADLPMGSGAQYDPALGEKGPHFAQYKDARVDGLGWIRATSYKHPNVVFKIGGQEQKKYKLAVNVVGNGNVKKTPDLSLYDHGTSVKLLATPGDQYSFSGWSDGLQSSENPITFTMTSDLDVKAIFVKDQPGIDIKAAIAKTYEIEKKADDIKASAIQARQYLGGS